MTYYTNEINEKITNLLIDGKVGLLPTDTIYGLSAVALNEEAVQKIHSLKERDSGKPLVVLIADASQLSELGLDSAHAILVEKYWPAPLSVEFDATNAPVWLHRGMNYFGVRLPNNDRLRSLIKKVGPIVSSSANIQGQKPAQTVEEAEKYFGDQLDFYVDTGKLVGQPSTLAKIENGQIKVLRQGTFKFST